MNRRLNLGVFVGARQHGRVSAVLGDVEPEHEYAFNLDRLIGPSAAHMQVQLRIREQALPGWQQATARLVIDGCWMDPLPLSWYDAKATDWPTGVARFIDPFAAQVGGQPFVWLLAVRRSE